MTGPATTHRSHGAGLARQLLVTSAWFGWNVQWGALIGVVLPNQIAAIVGPDDKELVNGLVGPLGAVVSLAITPLAGALSDRSTSRFGRRRPFMLAGTLVNMAALALLMGFGPGGDIRLFAGCVMAMQLGANWMGGPYAGLIPDVVPKERVGMASGIQGLMTALGLMVGVLAAGQLAGRGGYTAIYQVVIGLGVLSLLPTLFGVRETPRATPPAPFAFGPFARGFFPSPRAHRDYYWVLATRAMVSMGVHSTFSFFQYFLADVVRVPDPAKHTSFFLGVVIATGLPSTVLAGVLSDRWGRKPIVYASGTIMALASLAFIPDAYYPSTALSFSLAALFGIGNGAYEAVNWALAIDVLPSRDDAAKDMGIWHLALVIPQVIAPSMSGLVLTSLKGSSLQLAYTVVFAMAAAWFILGTAFARNIRRTR